MPDENPVGEQVEAEQATAAQDAPGDPQTDSPADAPAQAATEPPAKRTARKSTAKKAPAKKAAAKKATTKKAAAKKTATAEQPAEPPAEPEGAAAADVTEAAAAAEAPEKPAKKTAARKTAAKRTTKTAAAKKSVPAEPVPTEESATPPHGDAVLPTVETAADQDTSGGGSAEAGPGAAVLFQAPEPVKKPARRARKAAAPAEAAVEESVEESVDEEAAAEQPVPEAAAAEKPAKKAAKKPAKKAAKKSGGKSAGKAEPAAEEPSAQEPATEEPVEEPAAGEATGEPETERESPQADEQADEQAEGGARRRRRRGGRRRRKSGDGAETADQAPGEESEAAAEGAEESTAPGEDGEGSGESSSSRRRRRRRRSGDDGGETSDDPEKTVTRVRSRRSAEDEITAVSGSTRLEAKKQRRREGREAGRRRAPIVSEAEFLARRESVDRVMVIRQRDELTQIGVLEDRVLVEHYVARESQTSLIGNVYLGRVQNVLPSMEAAFIDIGKGRNAVLYAGEVNWSALGHKEGQPRKIENVLSSGQTVLVQVTKDPIGHKGARLTSQISLAGRFLVYVPDGTTSGISRKLPDTERNRLKALLKEIVPDTAGVIVRTAAEGASEDELTHDVERLKARWEDIEGKTKGSAPQLLYGEPDLTLKVVRDLFTEDFSQLVIQGDDAWDTVQGYVAHVAPDLEQRLVRYDPGPDGAGGKADVFAEYRIDEQISKGLDRKVWLPSGGSLIIDRTEAMTVIDVNTGKFTGSGGNLEETVTKNNLEAAEEIVRQLRLRDIGGIIVVDFIDMVLESNRDLVLRRLVECLGRDRTRHQVAEVTSLGLVQMTRKRIGTGLLESFSENCEHCQGRGVIVHEAPVEPKRAEDDARRGRRGRTGRARGQDQDNGGNSGKAPSAAPSPKDVAAMARPEAAEKPADQPTEESAGEPVAASTERPVDEAVEAVPAPATPPVEADETPERPSADVVEPVSEPVVDEPAPPSEPAPPRVVTRTRRRAASRPAGRPEPSGSDQARQEDATPATPVQAESRPEPVQPEPVQAEPAQPVSSPEPPKVVTRTRRRSASRPAGPPVHESGTESAGVGTQTLDGEAHDDDAHPVEHVPIKKKGSRKR